MLDWDELRSFLAIARHGNLSGAARLLKVQQSTMGRRLRALEARVGARLFQKTPSGFVLTPAGAAVLDHVEQMEAQALAAERAVSGRDVRLEGDVRMTTFQELAVEVLTPVFESFRHAYPGISLEIITEPRLLSLTRREADVGVRMARPPQSDVIVRKVGDIAFGVYASPAYLERHGVPDFAAGAPGHCVLLPEEDMMVVPEMKWFSALTTKATAVFRSNSSYLRRSVAEAGIGILYQQCFFCDSRPGLMRLAVPSARPAPVRELWMVVHRDTRHMPRIKALTEFLVAGLDERSSMLCPQE